MTQVLGRALVRNGHEVRTVGVYPEWYDAPEFEEDHGVQVWRFRERKHPLGWAFSRYLLYNTISSWSREGAIDLVEVPDYQGWAAGWRHLAVPVIARLNGSLTYFASELRRPIDKISYWLERASLRRADYSCSVCKYTARMTERVFKCSLGESAILYNPVDIPPTVNGHRRAEKRVVFSGTLTPKKGIVTLIKAWTLIANSSDDAELHIFGKDGRTEDGGSMQKFLCSLLSDKQRATVHFRGHVSRAELFEAYRTATVAVFPSYTEAFAIAPLEAMACGCPTIFSRRGSGPELLESGREGLLVDPDEPQSIAQAVQQVLGNRPFAYGLGEAGRRRVQENFSIERLIAQNTSFYEGCISDFRVRRPFN
jgi:glycosyltransferase involved in cell wall biosynthesis